MSKAALVGNAIEKNMVDFLINKCGLKPEEVQKLPGKDDFHFKGKGRQVKRR